MNTSQGPGPARNPATRYTVGEPNYGDVYDTWRHHLLIPLDVPGAYKRVAVTDDPELAAQIADALNDLNQAREHAGDELAESYEERAEWLRAELQRHQDALTRHAERQIARDCPSLAGVPAGVAVALDVIARAFVHRAVTKVLTPDSEHVGPGWGDWPMLGNYDWARVVDRARQLVEPNPELREVDAVEFLNWRTHEPDQIAGQPPAEPKPFPPPIGDSS
jgi:hypothetical protein